MNFKTPGTASCEWLTVLVKLPGETREKVELSVESEFIDIRSPKYRIFAFFAIPFAFSPPMEVKHAKSKFFIVQI